jgi:ribose transport system substrate-binding protein
MFVSRRLAPSTVGALSFALALSAAGTAVAQEGKAARIAYFLQGNTSYNQASAEKATEVATAKGATISVLSGDFDPSKQFSQCQDAITTGRYNAFVIYPVDGAGILPCVRQAIAAGIKVVALDSPLGPEFKIEPQVEGLTGSVLFPEPDDAEASFSMVKKACEGKDLCNTVYIIGSRAAAYDAAKLKEINRLYAENPTIKLVASGASDYSADGGLRVARDILVANQDIHVIFANDDDTIIGVEQAVSDTPLKGKVALIGSGASYIGVERIRAGRWFGSKVSLPQTNAEIAVTMAIDAVNGKAIEKSAVSVPEISPVGPVVTRENADKFEAQWGVQTN